MGQRRAVQRKGTALPRRKLGRSGPVDEATVFQRHIKTLFRQYFGGANPADGAQRTRRGRLRLLPPRKLHLLHRRSGSKLFLAGELMKEALVTGEGSWDGMSHIACDCRPLSRWIQTSCPTNVPR